MLSNGSRWLSGPDKIPVSTSSGEGQYLDDAFRNRQGRVDSMTELQNLPYLILKDGDSYQVTDSVREGVFVWKEGDFSQEVATDPTGGVFLPHADNLSGDVGCWVRQTRGKIKAQYFGIDGLLGSDHTEQFRNIWDFLRYQWFSIGNAYTFEIDVNINVTNPTEDVAGIAVYILDFPCVMTMARDKLISVEGSSAEAVLQIGTYETYPLYKEINGIRIDSGSTAGGYVFADCFQGLLVADNLVSQNSTVSYKVVNCQEIFARSLISRSPETGLVVSGNNEPRASGSNGSYSTGVGTSISNNNHLEVFVQAPTVSGVEIYNGTQNKVSGLVQGVDSSGWFVDIIGGTEHYLSDLWLESSTGVHRELRFRDTFTGSATLVNVHGATIGSQATIDGGTLTWLSSESWVGRIDVGDGASVITDYRGGAARTGNIHFIADSLPVLHNSSVTDVRPSNRNSFHKGVITGGDIYRFESFGNDASGNESKGFRAYLNCINNSTGAQCTVEVFADGRASFPNVRSSVEEKLGAMLDVGVSLNIYKAGSTPYHILRAEISNDNTTDDISFELWSYKFEM